MVVCGKERIGDDGNINFGRRIRLGGSEASYPARAVAFESAF